VPELLSGLTGILDAKLHPPAQKPGTVRRERLLRMLAGSPQASAVAVVAPLGYGKSTLLRQVAEEDERPTAWVSLDPRDDDPVVLIAHIAAAVARSRPDGRALEALESPGGSVWTTLMPRLSAAIAEDGPSLLILDDAHEVTSTDSADVLTWLALHVPRGSRLVVSARAPGRLPLARLRMSGRILELGPQDLALTDDEAVELLRGSGVSIDSSEATELNRRCEGWAGGIELAVLAGSVDESGSLVPRPVGSDHLVRDYVRSEVLARLSESEVDFLLRSSVLRRLTAGLCDAVLDTHGSGDMLHSLERSNALVTALDPDHVWYRYHDLFREALVAELERTDPTLPPRLRHRAAEWYASRGMADEAVSYAREAGEDATAARLVGAFAQSMYNNGRQATVVGWLDWVETAGRVGDDAELAMSGALVFALMGEAARADRWAAVLDRIASDSLSADRRAETWQMLLRGVIGRGGSSAALSAASRACELVPDPSPWRCLALTARGLCEIIEHQPEQARATIAEAIETGSSPLGQPNALSVAMGVQARLMLEVGDVLAARALVAQADKVRSQNGLTEQGPQAFIDALLSRIASADGDQEEASRRLVHAQRLRPLLSWAMPALAVMARLDMARADLALADPAGARTVLREIADVLHRRPGLGALEEEAEMLRERLANIPGGIVGASTLTTAELRIVPMLATHLSFHEIGQRLFISTNTVKTQVMSIYRKLDATSRTEAVQNATRVGLLDPASVTAILVMARRD
jgi:LuxR family transcriptional regulator, maltose regulon positive regulatory protein